MERKSERVRQEPDVDELCFETNHSITTLNMMPHHHPKTAAGKREVQVKALHGIDEDHF